MSAERCPPGQGWGLLWEPPLGSSAWGLPTTPTKPHREATLKSDLLTCVAKSV